MFVIRIYGIFFFNRLSAKNVDTRTSYVSIKSKQIRKKTKTRTRGRGQDCVVIVCFRDKTIVCSSCIHLFTFFVTRRR